MNAKSKTRQHVFGAAMLLAALVILVLLILGTGIQLQRMETRVEKQRQEAEEFDREAGKFLTREYLNIAVSVETRLKELHGALTAAAPPPQTNGAAPPATEAKTRRGGYVTPLDGASADRPAASSDAAREAGERFKRFNRRSTQFERWIRDEGRLVDEMAGLTQESLRRIESRQSIPRSIQPLLNEIYVTYERYKPLAQSVLTNQVQGMAASGDFEEATKLHQRLLELAEQASDSAVAISKDLQNQPPRASASPVMPYLLLAGMLGLVVFLVLAFRQLMTSELQLEVVRKDLQIEHQQHLSHFGQLAAGLAHEIRNPLTAMSARVYTLQKALAEGTPEHRDSQVIRDEVQRLDRIVQDFLKLARPAEPKLAPMSADPLLPKLRDLLAPQYEAQAIQLKVDSVAAARFRADEAQLKQVLINLIQNAAESMEKGGTITLRSRKDKIQLRGHDSEVVVIEVADTGPGIPPDVQERLFTPFFSTKEGGTGLGLPIAARIVNKHGGELKFESALNRGTTFRIVLPLYDKAT